jgi:hypothetical protein
LIDEEKNTGMDLFSEVSGQIKIVGQREEYLSVALRQRHILEFFVSPHIYSELDTLPEKKQRDQCQEKLYQYKIITHRVIIA